MVSLFILFSKMESFIRSKYESRRWALDGLPPFDPSVLENASTAAVPEQTQPASVTSTFPSHPTISSISRQPTVAINSPPQRHQLLSAGYSNRQPNITSADSSAPQPVHESTLQTNIPQNDLFSLDFHAPAPVNNALVQQVKKDVKHDILSLFSSPSGATQPATAGFGQFNNTPVTASSSPWGSIQPQQLTPTMGLNGVGAWGAPDLPNNVWANSSASPQRQQQATLLNTSNVWDGMNLGLPSQRQSQSTFSEPCSAAPVQKKDDVFGDLWGDFK
jgi:stromal membrane-associated protein